MPPRATSKTAVSTVGFWSTIWADFGPDMSPFLMSRPSTTMPSVLVMPTRRPISFMMWASIRTVVVLPFVPVTATIGIRADEPAGNSESMTGRATYCGSPSVGWVCIRKPGRRIDLDDRAAGLADGGRDVRADEVDAGDVEAHDLGRGLGDLDVVRVGLHRPVDRGPAGRHVAGQGELDPGPLGQDVVQAVALGADQLLGRLVHLDPGQDLLVADAAPGIGVGDVDELADGVLAVAGHAGRDALRDGRDLAADDEASIVVAGHVRLDDDVAAAALGEGAMERRPDRLLGPQVEVDAAAVVAVERLEHAWIADPLGRRDGVLLGVDDVGARDGQAGRVEQPIGQALVRRDVHADGRGLRRHRRPDPLLVDAVPELDERVAVEADERDVAADRLVDEGLGGRPERLPLGEADEPLHLGAVVEGDGRVVDGDEVVDERDRHPPGFEADGLFLVLEDAVVLAVLARRPGLAVADVRAGQVLELERDVLGDVADPRPLAQPADEARRGGRASRRAPRGWA